MNGNFKIVSQKGLKCLGCHEEMLAKNQFLRFRYCANCNFYSSTRAYFRKLMKLSNMSSTINLSSISKRTELTCPTCSHEIKESRHNDTNVESIFFSCYNCDQIWMQDFDLQQAIEQVSPFEKLHFKKCDLREAQLFLSDFSQEVKAKRKLKKKLEYIGAVICISWTIFILSKVFLK